MSRLFRLFLSLIRGSFQAPSRLIFAVVLVTSLAGNASAAMLTEGGNLALGAGHGLSSVLSPDGQLFFSYFDDARLLKLGRLSAGQWSSEVAAPTSTRSATALVLQAGMPHIFYYSGSGNLLHSYFSGSWQSETVDNNLGIGGGISAALCGSDICVSYYDATNADLKVLVGLTGSWQRFVADGAGDVGSMSQIAALPNGRPVVAYYDAQNQRPKVAQQGTGGVWSTESIHYLNRRFGIAPSIAVGSGGALHVACSRFRSAATEHELAVYYARKPVGSAWEVSEVAEDYAGGATSIALGSDGLPTIAYARLMMSDTYGDDADVEVASLTPSGAWARQELSRPSLPEAADYLFAGLLLARLADGNALISYAYKSRLGDANSGIRVHGAAATDSGAGSSSSSSGTTTSTSSSTGSSGSNPPTPSSSSSSSSFGTDPSSSSSSSSSSGGLNLGPDTDGDGTADSLDSDDDGDGLSDSEELSRGTDRLNIDTDRDGVQDGQEVLDGSNPLDSGSSLPVLSTTVCTEWNGFFGMWNIFEQVNLSSTVLQVETTLYDIGGNPKSVSRCDIAPGAQCDVLVHDMPGRIKDSYGKVCASHNGQKGDLDGRMVYYKQKNNTAFEFAMALPLSNGRTGRQFIPFNTYQPSVAAGDQGNMVANWIQLTNLASREVSGSLSYYAASGAPLARETVTLRAGARRDFPGHQFGPSLVGQVIWEPFDDSIPVQVRNVRYLYDNNGSKNSFTTAFQVDALVGSGEELSVPLDTRDASAILEILNNKPHAVTAAVSIYSASGVLKGAVSVPLAPYATYHLIADSILGAEQVGTAVLKGSVAESISAVAMEYRRSRSGAIDYVFGTPAQQALGTVLSGSYNTFLGQASSLLLLNPKNAVTSAYLSVTRSNGSPRAAGARLDLPANGMKVVDLRNFDTADQYGVVRIQTAAPNTIVAWVNRTRGADFVIPTPVRQ